MNPPTTAAVSPRPGRAPAWAGHGGEHPTIPIVADTGTPPAHQGCGACLQAEDGPLCQVRADEHRGAPDLAGPPEELQALLRALAGCLGFDAAAPDGRLIRSLTVLPGEVSLVLGVGRHCGGALLADAAFQTLRRLRPDTDIYVTHAA